MTAAPTPVPRLRDYGTDQAVPDYDALKIA
jgi:hypothetical protein